MHSPPMAPAGKVLPLEGFGRGHCGHSALPGKARCGRGGSSADCEILLVSHTDPRAGKTDMNILKIHEGFTAAITLAVVS